MLGELQTQRVTWAWSSKRVAAMIVLGCAYWAAVLAFLRASDSTHRDFLAHLHVVSVLFGSAFAPTILGCLALDSTRARFSNRVVALLAALLGYTCSAVLLCIGRMAARTLLDDDWSVYCGESDLSQPLALIFIGQLVIGFAVYWIRERTRPAVDRETRSVSTHTADEPPILQLLDGDVPMTDAGEMEAWTFDCPTPANRSGSALRLASVVVFGAAYWVMLQLLISSVGIGGRVGVLVVSTFLAACWFVPVCAGSVAAELREHRGGNWAIVALACGVGTVLPILLALPAPVITGVAVGGSREFGGYCETVGFFFPIMLFSGLAISGGVHLIRALTP